MLKNILLLLLVAACAYQYLNPKVEVHEVRVPVPVVKAAGPKLYYHSPLDAPAMPTGANTGTGYFSTEAASRFNSPAGTGGNRAGSGSGPVRSSAARVDPANPLASVDALQSKLSEQP